MYAIGEIFLVVIGILLALQVNNWNIEKKNQLKAKNLSNNLLKELSGVKNLMENRLDVMQNQQKLILYLINNNEIRMDSVLSLPKSGELSIDPLNFLFSYVAHFNPRADIYRSAISEGALALIGSKHIIKQLNTAYTMSEKRLSDHIIAENSINALLNEHISNEYQSIFNAAELINTNGAWDRTTTQNILKKIGTDGKLRYLLSAKLQILQFKYGDLKHRIFPAVENSMDYFENGEK
jgi:hypothetical protein